MARFFYNIVRHGFITVIPGAFQAELVTHMNLLLKQQSERPLKKPVSIRMI